MNKFLGIFLIVIAFIFVLHFFGKIFLPTDILNYFPSFSQSSWTKPHNSLLADPVFQFEPWRIFAKEELLRGKIPIWNNLNATGVPFLANMQNAVFFPLNFFYYVFPPSISLFLIASLKYVLFVLFSILYLRQLKISKFSAVLSSLIASSSYMVIWLQWPQTNVFLCLPLILLLIEKLSVSKNKFHYLALLSVTYFIAITGGHPETFFNIFLIACIYILVVIKKRNIFLIHALAVFWGCVLGSFLLVPFIEYLVNSYAAYARSISKHAELPLWSFVSLLNPIVLGGPQFSLYKPFSALTNFAETSVVFVGPIAAILAIRMLKLKSFGIKFIFLAFICFLLAYFPILSVIPIVHLNASSRFAIFIPFFLSIAAGFSIDQLDKKSYAIKFKQTYGIGILGLSMIALLFVPTATNTESFFIFSVSYILFLLFTSFLFFLVLSHSIKFKRLILTTIITLQIIFPVISYNGFNNTESYYPRNSFINSLTRINDARVIQVGNINLPADINMAYGIESAENYDALDIKNYKDNFDKAFPLKNHMGIVDEVSPYALKKFGINTVISDYDINLRKITVQKNIDQRISLRKPLVVYFENKEGNLKEIRLITQNFNRSNKCKVRIQLLNGKQLLSSTLFNCLDARDNMYITVPISGLRIDSAKKYQLRLEPVGFNSTNEIALRGSGGIPYVDLLIEQNQHEYKLLYKGTNVSIFTVNYSSKIDYGGTSSILENETNKISIVTNSSNNSKLTLKNSFYPGWEAYINNRKVIIIDRNPFMSVQVPKGENLVEFIYKPKSLYLGSIVSFIGFLVLTTYFLRKIIKNKKFFGIRKKVFFEKHAKYFFSGAIISEIILVTGLKIFSFEFYYPMTTAINWFTVHKYPRQQEYFFFLLLFFIPLFFGILSWLILVRRGSSK